MNATIDIEVNVKGFDPLYDKLWAMIDKCATDKTEWYESIRCDRCLL